MIQYVFMKCSVIRVVQIFEGSRAQNFSMGFLPKGLRLVIRKLAISIVRHLWTRHFSVNPIFRLVGQKTTRKIFKSLIFHSYEILTNMNNDRSANSLLSTWKSGKWKFVYFFATSYELMTFFFGLPCNSDFSLLLVLVVYLQCNWMTLHRRHVPLLMINCFELESSLAWLGNIFRFVWHEK